MKTQKNLSALLQGIKSFSELEKELSSISNDKEKGDLFELFCQVYLKVIYKKQAFKSIELFKDISPTTLKRLNLRLGKDYGIDIVALTDSDDIWAIQVKFRQSDQLTWTELSTFRASSEKAAFRIVMSNVSKVLHPHTTLANFSSILRNEFEALTEEDFSNIKSALKGQAIKRKKFVPRAHQTKAIKAAVNHFKTNDFGQMIHACGTGKTLTSLWIKEALRPKNTIVYMPSLSLLKQTLEEWTKHKSLEFSIKCVCSDQSVFRTAQELDEAIVDVTELGVPVTTNAKEIAEFLSAAKKDSVIFSTYQSAPVVLEAMKILPKFSFDFGVFDEAHRTASKSEHLFTQSLNTKVQKKLFMTATPKLYAPHVMKRAKEEDVLLCSMDDHLIYGKVFDEIKFGEAIKLGLLSDYKVKVIVVSNENIKELIDRRYWLEVLGKEVTADELAKVWALLKSLDDANHVISFHSRIHGAREFQTLVDKTIELLKFRKKEARDVKIYHISGEMPTYLRSKILSEFISQKKSLVTNARCLTEGVDVPAIDGVYFVDPKQNLIDIVQAVGRAIRKKPTKYGYIIIPVFIGDETDTEQIIESSAFAQVWNVVEAMKDRDARLSHIIESLQELKGKKKFGSLLARELSEELALKADLANIFDLSDSILPKNIDIPSFIEYIGLKTLEIIGQSWDERFGEYKMFKEENGHKPMETSKDRIERRLGAWASKQIVSYNKKELSEERINRLNSIGFVWDHLETTWLKSFSDYVSFKKKFGDRTPSETSKDKSEKALHSWISTQRKNYKDKKLTKEKIDKLNQTGFVWHVLETSWNQSFNDYRSFKNKYNREPSEISKDESEKTIGKWASTQRKAYKNNKMPKDRVEKLSLLGFKWDVIESIWEKAFSDYQKFKEKNDREPLTISKDKTEKYLGLWAVHQRMNYKKNKLAKDRISRLNSISFVWDNKEDSWNSSFISYKNFKEKYGKEPSHGGKEESERILADWATKQRKAHDEGRLSKERVDKLDSIEFILDIRTEQWEEAFEEYRNFKLKFQREPSNNSKIESEKALAQWCGDQRKAYKKSKILKERADKLNSVGFIWDIIKTSWDNSLKDYLFFKEKNGREPNSNSKIDSEKFLALWAVSQRVRAKINKVSKERIKKLNSVNFVWDQKEDWWEQTFKDYRQFKESNGRFPSEESKNKLESSLGRWAGKNRQDKKKNKMSQVRIDKLNSIGFVWKFRD